MMNQPNTLVTTEWLLPLLEAQLSKLHSELIAEAQAPLTQIAQSYRELAGVMKVANLNPFADLAYCIEAILNAVNADQLPEIYSQKGLYASQLIGHELNNYVETGRCHEQLLINRYHYLTQVLQSHGAIEFLSKGQMSPSSMQDGETQQTAGVDFADRDVTDHDGNEVAGTTSSNVGQTIDKDSQFDNFENANVVASEQAEISRLEDYINLPDADASDYQVLSVAQRQLLSKAWRVGIQSLLLSQQNDAQSLERMGQVAQYLKQHALASQQKHTANLWYLVELWLESMERTERPKPSAYAYLLSQLDTRIRAQQDDAQQDSALIIEVYLQLQALAEPSENATFTLNAIAQGIDQNRVFFPRVLSELEKLIFKLDDSPKQLITSLKRIKSQLLRRGWHRFEEPLNQVLADLEYASESEEVFEQMRWQIERQLQDVYGLLFASHQTIDSQIGQTSAAKTSDTDKDAQDLDPQSIRKARIAIEDIKQAFSGFLYQHDSQLLNRSEEFATLSSVFAEMGMSDVVDITNRTGAIFSQLVASEHTHITWAVADAITDLLAKFELFMDYLAQQTLSDDLLDEVKSSLEQAEQHLVALIEDPELLVQSLADMDERDKPQTNAVRYDDAGEIEPDADSPVTDDIADDTRDGASPTQSGVVIVDDTVTEFADTDGLEASADVEEVTSAVGLQSSPELMEAREALKDDDFGMDEDIREIFIEEADEVLTVLDAELPNWQADPHNFDPLTEIRRGFHTLKGSGRMVGAFSAGELAWAVENLLNRVLDGTLSVTDELVQFIMDTKAIIPTLVNDFANNQPPSVDPAITVLKAQNLQKGRDIDYGLTFASNEEGTDVTVVEPANQPVTDAIIDDAIIDDESVDDLQTQVSDSFIEETSTRGAGVAALPAVLEPFMSEIDLPADAEDADEDIKEIFIEEAGEVLETITPQVKLWQQDLADVDALTEVRRGFHTLKGSGRMVGANTSAELAWAVENMLNRVLDNTIAPSKGLQALVGDVVAVYPNLVGTFEKGSSDYPDKLPLWIATANAYSKNHGEAFDYRDVKNLATQQNATQSETQNLAQSVGREHATTNVADADGDDSLEADRFESTGEIDSSTRVDTSGNEQPNLEPMDELEQVFVEEAEELVEQIQSFVASAEDTSDDIAVNDDLVRAFHTLRGASASQELSLMTELTATLEQNLEQLQHTDEPMQPNHLEAVAQSAQVMQSYLEDLQINHNADFAAYEQDVEQIKSLLVQEGQGESEHLNVADLIAEGVDELLDGEWELEGQLSHADTKQVADYANTMSAQAGILLNRVSDFATSHQSLVAKFDTILTALQGVYQHIASEPSIMQVSDQQDAIISALLAGHEQLTFVLDAIAGGMTSQVDEQVIADLHGIAEPAASPVPQQDNEQTSVQSSDKINNRNEIQRSSVVSVRAEFETIDTDPELLAIFLEEAQEVDADIVNSFSAWSSNPSDMSTLKVLQRHLHTIKGGARMAGISSIGDLTHEAETIYENFVEGKVEPTSDWVSLMQQVQDVLSAQIDYVVTHGQSYFATDMVEQLQVLAHTKTIPEALQLKIPVVSAPSTDSDKDITQDANRSDNDVDNNATDDANADVVDDAKLSEAQRIEREHNELLAQSWAGNPPDADILDVFLEEAVELVDSGATHLQTFRSNTSDIATLQELQRELHTMKGGARMVGANGLADLAHHMETVYEDLATRRRPATRLVSELLANSHDWMADGVYLLQKGLNPPTPNELIQALQKFSRKPDTLQTLPTESLQSYRDAIDRFESTKDERLGRRDISELPPTRMHAQFSEEAAGVSGEMIRVSSNMMEQMINLSGESAINRARIDMSVTSLNQTIDEMGMTVQRLADQLRRMDGELEAQILSQIDEAELLDTAGFDPLEMDQYSSLNQLSKSLSESASDLLDIKATMLDKTRDAENLLLQLSRTQAELQDGLMNSRMVPFTRLTPRLQRIVRQTANELGKSVELVVTNADDEMDRTILERITSPLEHMLRNAVDHGIETPDEREALDKPRTGRIVLSVTREGSEVVIRLSDDGSGINVDAVRAKAIKQGLIDANDTSLSDLDVMQYIFNAGLTTTNKVTQISGRGVGMDVVLSEVRQLGGTVSVDSSPSQGSVFSIRVPLTVAVSDALVVRVADRYYAIPLVQIDRVERVNPEALLAYYQSSEPTFDIGGTPYRLRYLNEMLTGTTLNQLAVNTNLSLPVIIVKNQTGQNLAIQVDEVAGSRIEVVVKPLGRQLSHISGISSATIMGDGSVMLILDMLALLRNAPARSVIEKQAKQDTAVSSGRTSVLIVDDSVTVRKVTSRLLERQGYDAHTARDGADALEILQDFRPDVMLLDIEMPRMDGFEVASTIRRDSELKDLPIIMITSRTGDKHRERAMEIGVNEYMGKPFQEAQLISTIQSLTDTTMGEGSGTI